MMELKKTQPEDSSHSRQKRGRSPSDDAMKKTKEPPLSSVPVEMKAEPLTVKQEEQVDEARKNLFLMMLLQEKEDKLQQMERRNSSLERQLEEQSAETERALREAKEQQRASSCQRIEPTFQDLIDEQVRMTDQEIDNMIARDPITSYFGPDRGCNHRSGAYSYQFPDSEALRWYSGKPRWFEGKYCRYGEKSPVVGFRREYPNSQWEAHTKDGTIRKYGRQSQW